MTQINLLPWREQIKQEMNLRYGLNLAFHLVILLLIVIFINVFIYARIALQESRNNYLRLQMGFENERLISLNKETKDLAETSKSLRELLSLKESSFQAVRQLNEIVNVVPADVTLTKLVRKGSSITISGYTKSNLQITQLMKNVNASTVFRKPDLTEINQTEGDHSSEKHFVLKIETKPVVGK